MKLSRSRSGSDSLTNNVVRRMDTHVENVNVTAVVYKYCCLKKNLNASTPFEHPPTRGKIVKMFTVGGILVCKDKNSYFEV